MDHTQIFYWTGVVCWYILCVSFTASVLVAGVVAPFFTLKKTKKYMWQWRYASEVVGNGLTQEDIKYALADGDTPDGYDVQKMVAWVESIKKRSTIRKGYK